ncbi:hypothetical protein [Streptomyces sp. 7N604]|uniref:hypothetical protein n=1 Tax=Streptomyces sp. 7N604 TaxID=3457415 RepID=UPI003FD34E57
MPSAPPCPWSTTVSSADRANDEGLSHLRSHAATRPSTGRQTARPTHRTHSTDGS